MIIYNLIKSVSQIHSYITDGRS